MVHGGSVTRLSVSPMATTMQTAFLGSGAGLSLFSPLTMDPVDMLRGTITSAAPTTSTMLLSALRLQMVSLVCTPPSSGMGYAGLTPREAVTTSSVSAAPSPSRPQGSTGAPIFTETRAHGWYGQLQFFPQRTHFFMLPSTTMVSGRESSMEILVTTGFPAFGVAIQALHIMMRVFSVK